MEQSSPSPRKVLGRVCIVVAMMMMAWALVIYPIAFEYASREVRAAGAHKLAFFPAGMAAITSGWFTAFLIVSSLAAAGSLWRYQDSKKWRRFEWGVLLLGVGLVAVHVIYDGPAYVARNVWSVATHPSSFHWPLDYFSLAVRDWGAWP